MSDSNRRHNQSEILRGPRCKSCRELACDCECEREPMKKLLILSYPGQMSTTMYEHIRRSMPESLEGTEFEDAAIIILENGLTISQLSSPFDPDDLPEAADLLAENGYTEIAELLESLRGESRPFSPPTATSEAGR